MASTEETYRRPFLTRIVDQLLPSALTALAMGALGYKVMESDIAGLKAQNAQQQVSIDRNTLDIVRSQERQLSFAERLNIAASRTDETFNRMEARLLRMESRVETAEARIRSAR